MIRSIRRHWLAARWWVSNRMGHALFSQLPLTDTRALTPGHLWITQNTYPESG
jgi:hypothetical protein